MHFVDEINFVTPFCWRVPHVFSQLTDVFDTIVAGAIDLDHVETVASGNFAAIIALAARRNGRAFNAIE